MIAVDFDDTLNYVVPHHLKKEIKFIPNKNLIESLLGSSFLILTARKKTKSNETYIRDFLKEYRLPQVEIYFTNGKPKGSTLKSLIDHYNVKIMIDNDYNQIESMKGLGCIILNPENLSYPINFSKIKRSSIIKNFYLTAKNKTKKKKKKKKKDLVPEFFRENLDFNERLSKAFGNKKK